MEIAIAFLLESHTHTHAQAHFVHTASHNMHAYGICTKAPRNTVAMLMYGASLFVCKDGWLDSQRGSRQGMKDVPSLPPSHGRFVGRWCWCEGWPVDCCSLAFEIYLRTNTDNNNNCHITTIKVHVYTCTLCIIIITAHTLTYSTSAQCSTHH